MHEETNKDWHEHCREELNKERARSKKLLEALEKIYNAVSDASDYMHDYDFEAIRSMKEQAIKEYEQNE